MCRLGTLVYLIPDPEGTATAIYIEIIALLDFYWALLGKEAVLTARAIDEAARRSVTANDK